MTTNSVNIFFGTVVNNLDELKLKRVQVKINGVTDLLEDADLPWYFPFNFSSFLLSIGDVVAVLIINGRVEHGFYSYIYTGNSEELSSDNRPSTGLPDNKNDIAIGDDYEHYLELLYRKIDDKQIKMTYSKSEGIVFENSEDSKIHIELEKISIFQKTCGIEITEKELKIGNSEKDYEKAFNAETTLKVIEAMIEHEKTIFTALCDYMTKISAAAGSSPFTSALIPVGTALVASNMPTFQKDSMKNKQDLNAKNTLSETVKISK
jgi:hypothetical protein